MFKPLSAFVVILFLCSCSPESQETPQSQASAEIPLHVTDIKFDDDETTEVRQIVFQFNQNVAMLGAVPSQAQTTAVTISNDLHKHCRWRFINLNQLSCELTKNFKYLTDYKVSINDSFAALGKPLDKGKTTTISSGLPKLRVEFNSNGQLFAETITINQFPIDKLNVDSFVDAIKLKSPNGRILELEKSLKKNKWNDFWSLTLTLAEKSIETPNGRYDLLFDFAQLQEIVASKNQTLNNTILASYWFSDEFEFYGFACKSEVGERFSRNFVDIEYDATLPLDCAPEGLAMVFSRSPKPKTNASRMHGFAADLSGLVGPMFRQTGNRYYAKNGKFYLGIEFSGSADYQLDLGLIHPEPNSAQANAEIISFKTRPASPLWQFDKHLGTVVDAQTNVSPLISRRNLPDLEGKVSAIENADALLRFINKQAVEIETLTLPDAEYTQPFIAYQTLEIKNYLASKSGLVNVALSGAVAKSADELESKVDTQIFQSAAYNLIIWHDKDLVLQALSWQDKPLAKVEVRLVCKGFSQPKVLGNTDENGLLWLTPEVWQGSYNQFVDTDCWLWTELENQSAAIELPRTDYRIDSEIEAFAWTAQPIYNPGEEVKIGLIARQRSEHGLTPIANFDDYEFSLRRWGDKDTIDLAFSTPSKYGFSSAEYRMPYDGALGYYGVIITHKESGVNHQVSSFIVAEFTAPEFEFSIDAPERLEKGEVVTAKIFANRMNGSPLANAQVEINYSVKRNYDDDVFDSWAENFEFVTWTDVSNSQTDADKGKVSDLLLSENGSLNYESNPVLSKIPYGQLEVEVEVTADDGETQHKIAHIDYFGRSHFIGSQYDAKAKKLNLVAFDAQGSPLSQLPIKVVIYSRESRDDDEKPRQILQECQLVSLPDSCLVSDINEYANVEIISGGGQYTWYRSYNFETKPVAPEPDETDSISLEVLTKNVKANQTVEVAVSSSVEGNATFIISANKFKKVWQQKIEKGASKITLETDASWTPYAKLYVSLPYQPNSIEKESIADEQNLRISRPMPPGHGKPPLKFDERIQVAPASNTPKVSLEVNNKKVEAGSTVTLSLTSNIDSESQVWLVNDALLQLIRKKIENYDYSKKVHNRYSFHSGMQFDALSMDLIDQALFEKIASEISQLQSENKMMMRRGVPQPPPEFATVTGLNSPGLSDGGEAYSNLMDFRQSVWVDTVSLQAEETQNIEVKLPQLIGRWQVIALTANDQTFALNDIEISTVRDVDIFWDSPSTIYQNDQSQFTVSMLNRGNDTSRDKLTIWNGDAVVTSKVVEMKGGDYQRIPIDLPPLPVGKHTLILTSQSLPDFRARHHINVLSSKQKFERTWALSENQDTKIKLDDEKDFSNVALSSLPTGLQVPLWSSLSDYTQHYEHQCWEQTLSRAISYEFNPLSKTLWPEGIRHLNSDIRDGASQQSYGLFSYFPNMKPDLFLMAYTHLASGWMKNSAFKIDSDAKELKDFVIPSSSPSYLSSMINMTSQAHSLIMLALAVNRDIDLNEALKIRQRLGLSDRQSTVMQALALKELGAEPALYIPLVLELQNQQYVDENIGLFNENSEKCFAAMVFDEGSKEREALLAQVTTEQQHKGHFGSTFANAICTYALKDAAVEVTTINSYQPVDFVNENNVLSYQLDKPQSHWLKLSYSQQLSSIKPKSLGIDIARTLYVKRNQTWQEVDSTTQLKIGELIKSSIIINNPTEREHIAITDSIAGGFEAINPDLDNNTYFTESYGENWYLNNHIQIRNGKAYWYVMQLPSGEHTFTYFSRVRHSGKYNIGPVSVEAMYRSDVKANTASFSVNIKN